ncbi:MAG: hypothetical protein Q9165_004668 [Trypethelium subeluteriae]
MSDERIAKENLRRRFEQNQEDCTLTVLALLPTLRENVVDALPVERILDELQQKKAERLSKSVGASDLASSDVQSGPSVPPSVTDEDGSTSFQTGSYIHTSQMAQNPANEAEGTTQKPKKSKTQLWNEMKISFSLAAPPRRDAQIALENHDDDNFEQAYGNDFETNRQYLAFSWWLLHRGSKAIMEKVQEVVIDIFGPLNLREEISMEKLSQLTLELRKKIEGATEEDRRYASSIYMHFLSPNNHRSMRWLTYLLPPTTSESFVLQESGIIPPPSPPVSTSSSPLTTEISSSLRRLLDETSDLIDSPTFSHVLTLLLDSGFSLLIDSKIASQIFKLSAAPSVPPPATLYASSPSATTPRIEELPDNTLAKAKLASLLAVFCKQAHAIGAGDGDGEPDDDTAAAPSAPGPGNEYLAAMDTVRDLEAFAAVVYSSNFEWEAAAEQEEELEAGSSTAAAQESKRVSSLWGDSKRVSAVLEGEGRPGTGESLAEGWEGAWTRALAREDGREAER